MQISEESNNYYEHIVHVIIEFKFLDGYKSLAFKLCIKV